MAQSVTPLPALPYALAGFKSKRKVKREGEGRGKEGRKEREEGREREGK